MAGGAVDVAVSADVAGTMTWYTTWQDLLTWQVTLMLAWR